MRVTGPSVNERGALGRSARKVGALALLLFGLLAFVGAASAAAQDDGSGPARVLAATVDGPITPVIAGYVADGIANAEREGYVAYVIRLDTPGGLDTSMREIVQHIFAAEVPVIVYVAPSGARGASAGAIITFAAHVAAMAPGTAIGAATPVAGESGDDLEAKIINDAVAYVEAIAELRDRDRDLLVDTVRGGRSVSASEALDLGAIDVIAGSTTELLTAVDGMTVVVGATDREVTLHTAGAAVDGHEMGVFRSILKVLADPNVAFLLLSIGTLGLIYELASPGIGVSAVLGLTFVVLGLFGLSVLSVNLVGVVFLLLAGVLFVTELFAPGIGPAAGGGTFALVMSGIFLFDDTPGLQISLAVVLPVAIVVGGFVIIAGRVAIRARKAPSTTTGSGLFVGRDVTVRADHGEPQVFVEGAWWGVRPADPGTGLAGGSLVRIVDIDGLRLVVAPSPSSAESPSSVVDPGDSHLGAS